MADSNIHQVAGEIEKYLDENASLPLCDRTYLAMRKAIILGNISGGQQFFEYSLANVLNMSRTPLRYAIDRLIDEQLVTRERGRGVTVTGLDSEATSEIFSIRFELDSLATRNAMQRMSKGDYDCMSDLLREAEDMNKHDKVSDVVNSLSLFNRMIYSYSEMPHLKAMVTDISTYLIYFRDANLTIRSRRQRALEEHWRIFNAMVSRDSGRVTQAVVQHLDHSQEAILHEMNTRSLLPDKVIQRRLNSPWIYD
ncbi:GntR family transcriptional regulator [Lacticaseibacillus baoqingensis]|uniref:GntR family transcriptional regulator n=1 Tax=Lacticaseibacillus baoqingensis TaxID=2486013 RepID=A0ABW4EAX0_9LACO|nr:GntR family transcriptional regulator [Lacticaseibacillus baoqingensis]